MCLAAPGKIISLSETDSPMRMGRVSFGGVVKEVCLAYLPDARVGDYVVVHAGFAISRVDAEEALAVFRMLEEEGE